MLLAFAPVNYDIVLKYCRVVFLISCLISASLLKNTLIDSEMKGANRHFPTCIGKSMYGCFACSCFSSLQSTIDFPNQQRPHVSVNPSWTGRFGLVPSWRNAPLLGRLEISTEGGSGWVEVVGFDSSTLEHFQNRGLVSSPKRLITHWQLKNWCIFFGPCFFFSKN